jgi:hypothetical protein
MILTWLWKLLLAFRRRGEAPVLAAPTEQAPKARVEDYAPSFINESTDANNSEVVVFGDDDGPPPASPGR